MLNLIGPAMGLAASILNKVPDPDRPTRQAKRAARLIVKLVRSRSRKKTPMLRAKVAGWEFELAWLLARIQDDNPDIDLTRLEVLHAEP